MKLLLNSTSMMRKSQSAGHKWGDRIFSEFKKGNANNNKKNDEKTGDNKNEGEDSNITLPARIILFVERRATGQRNARSKPTRTRRN